MAKERKGYTEDQVAEIKRRRDERNAATKAIIDLLCSKGIEDITKADLQMMKETAELAAPKSGGRSGSGSARVAVMTIVSGIFDEVKEINEDQVFVDHKLGRTEMTTAIKNIIKKFEPAARKWISFDPESGSYKLEGKGANPPKNWKGYVPVEETLEEEDLTDEE